MNLRITHTILLLLGLSAAMFGQTKKAWIEAAEIAISDKDFHSATQFFKTALEFDTADVFVIHKAADAARQFNAYSFAVQSYEKLIELDENGEYPLSTFHLAEMYQKLGRYDDAIRNYELYLSENNGDDQYYSLKANKEIEASQWALGEKGNDLDYITVENAGGEINTEYSEFGAQKVDGDLYYSSLRFDDTSEESPSNRKLSKLLKSDGEGLNGLLENEVNNSNQLVAHTAINMNKTRVYYTVCEYINSYDIVCDLHYRSIDDEGNFGESTRLPTPINADGATNTQPNIAYDKNVGREILYFVSDRDGGKGKLDIWYSVIESDTKFSDPKNLSEINTAEDELSPFYQSDSGSLYFSSNGRLGFGGYDVYRADYKEDEAQFVNIENMGSPINTSYHDLYYTINEEGSEGFMSSNRTGSKYLETQIEACCYDIYRVDIEEFDVIFNALTFNKTTGDSLVATTVRILDVATNEEIAVITNPDDNDHIFTLPSGREYLVIAEREGFSSDTVSLSTRNIRKGEEIVKKLYLEQEMTILDVFTYDESTKQDLSGVTIILENLDDPSIVDVIRFNETTNDFNFELDPCTKYRITAFKDGFESQSFEIDTCDPANQGRIRRDLFMGKPNLNIYLPVTLYFDNDYPDPRSRNMYTLSNYTDTYYPYYAKKEEFKTKVSAGASGDMQYTAAQELEYFFEDRVKGEYDKMQLFLDKLLERLRNGESFEVAIKGFASPKAANKYNLALGQRRVYSLRNEMRDFASGAFDQYLNSGALILNDVSYGEELAPKGISDSNTNTKKSIYSVEASSERRAQIVSVRKLN